MSLARGFLTVGGMTLISRVLGLAREIIIAATLGAGGMADAFYAAFRLPNLFRRIFAEGAFSMAFIPLFTKRMEDGTPEAKQFGEEALALLASVLFVITLVATLLMPVLMYLLAAGFAAEPEKFDRAVLLARVMFPYLLLVSLTALFSAVLNALGRFAVAAGAPILLNIFMIAAAAWAATRGEAVELWLSIGVALSGVAQLALVAWAARKAGMRFTLRRPRITGAMRQMLNLAAPAALAGGAQQINLLIGSVIASFFAGAVSWLTYADRLYQLPLGVVGIAVGVVLMPELSRRVKLNDREGARESMNRAIEFALALTIPAAIALMIIPVEIARALFERGAFSTVDAQQTGLAALLFAIGLPAFVLNKVLTPAFFADEDSRTPLRLALWMMGINSALSLIGVMVLGWLAVPLATSIAAWINVVWLWAGLRKRGYGMDVRLWRKLKRSTIAAIGMGALLWVCAYALQGSLEPQLARLAGVFGLLLVGVASYALIGQWLGAFSLSELKQGMRRGP